MCSYIFSKENLYILFRNLLRTHLDQIHVFRPEHEPNGPLPEDIHLFTPYLLRRNVIRFIMYIFANVRRFAAGTKVLPY